MFNRYLNYLWKSHNLHGVHSPFVYEFNEKVLNHRIPSAAFSNIEKYTRALSSNYTELVIEDMGSGSKRMKSRNRKVSDIYKNTATNRRFGEILYRIIQFYSPQNILELGTGLGVGTLYMLESLKNSTNVHFTSIEGCKALHEFANQHLPLKDYRFKIDLICAEFQQSLSEIIEKKDQLDLVFIDGNHSYAGTLNYFWLLSNKMSENGIMIIDDIHWSRGMRRAWQDIQYHHAATFTIDLYRWGIVFFKKGMAKEHFTLRFNDFLKAHIG